MYLYQLQNFKVNCSYCLFVYLLLRIRGIKYEQTEYILATLDLFTVKSCSSWAQLIIDDSINI